MGIGTLTDRSNSQVIDETFFNEIHAALNSSFVGRSVSGVATSGQDLGTSVYPWGTIYATDLNLNGEGVDISEITLPRNRVISGKTRTSSNQPAFITPNGSALSFIVAGATTNLVVDVNGSEVTCSTDITKTGLTAAPSSNNTCTINYPRAASNWWTRNWGESSSNPTITVDAMGSELTALIGKICAFKVGTEYFIGKIKSSTEIKECFRGFFYNSSLAPMNRVTCADNDTITLVKLGWVFLDEDGITVDVSYTNPIIQSETPAATDYYSVAIAAGDYWYDLANQVWKRYSGSTWETINRTLIGMVVNNTTACVGARCVDFYAAYSELNSVMTEIIDVSHIRMVGSTSEINVAGNVFRYHHSGPVMWDMATMLAGAEDIYALPEQNSVLYYFYIKDTGALVISDIMPYDRQDLKGRYHPHNPWRCVAYAYNTAAGSLQSPSSYANDEGEIYRRSTSAEYGSTNTLGRRYSVGVKTYGSAALFVADSTYADYIEIQENGWYTNTVQWEGSTACGVGMVMNMSAADREAGTPVDVTSLNYAVGTAPGDGYLPLGYGFNSATATTSMVMSSGAIYLRQGDRLHVQLRIADTAPFSYHNNFWKVSRIPSSNKVVRQGVS